MAQGKPIDANSGKVFFFNLKQERNYYSAATISA